MFLKKPVVICDISLYVASLPMDCTVFAIVTVVEYFCHFSSAVETQPDFLPAAREKTSVSMNELSTFKSCVKSFFK